MLLSVLLAAAVSTVSLGGYVIGQDLSEARAAAARNNDELRLADRRGRWSLYGIWSEQGTNLGNVATCDGRVWSVVMNVNSYDDFVLALRQRVESWGQPTISFPLMPQSDDARTFEAVEFTWPQRRFAITFNAKSADGLNGAQILSGPVRTCR